MPIYSVSDNSTLSGFLVKNTTIECPSSLLSLASLTEPKPFAFVRAIGAATLQTAMDASRANLVTPILVGEQDIITADAEAIGWDLGGVEIISSRGEDEAIMAAVALFAEGRIAGLAKGQIHTDVFMSGIVKRSSGIRTEKRLVHVFLMIPPGEGKPLLISDAAVNVAPDIKTRVEAALHIAELSRKLGCSHPRIAVLSATESILPAMPSSAEAAEIASLAAIADTKAEFMGPLSFDLAVAPKAAQIKGVSGSVVGMADGLVVPDIVSGNILFKSLVWFSGGLAAGLVLGGAIPIVLTSRSDPSAARLASIALAAVVAKNTL